MLAEVAVLEAMPTNEVVALQAVAKLQTVPNKEQVRNNIEEFVSEVQEVRNNEEVPVDGLSSPFVNLLLNFRLSSCQQYRIMKEKLPLNHWITMTCVSSCFM